MFPLPAQAFSPGQQALPAPGSCFSESKASCLRVLGQTLPSLILVSSGIRRFCVGALPGPGTVPGEPTAARPVPSSSPGVVTKQLPAPRLVS